jgi:type II pantothenate kinase
LHAISAIAATGGGARMLGNDLLGVPVRKVAEITAIGVGGSTLAGQRDALVVSMGTGTAIVSVQGDTIQHVGGTGVGGGTLLGLSKHLLNVSRLETLQQMAERGDLSRIDLTVGDIAGGPVGTLPADATASNFGKLSSDATPDDKARALVNMIAEVIVVLSVTAARASGLHDIVLTGKLVRVKPFIERIKATRQLFERNFIIPPHAEFATAIGAARSMRG